MPGKEVTVGILDDRPLGALEVVAKGEFHTYEVKYTAGREEFFMPARLSRATTERVSGTRRCRPRGARRRSRTAASTCGSTGGARS